MNKPYKHEFENLKLKVNVECSDARQQIDRNYHRAAYAVESLEVALQQENYVRAKELMEEALESLNTCYSSLTRSPVDRILKSRTLNRVIHTVSAVPNIPVRVPFYLKPASKFIEISLNRFKNRLIGELKNMMDE